MKDNRFCSKETSEIELKLLQKEQKNQDSDGLPSTLQFNELLLFRDEFLDT